MKQEVFTGDNSFMKIQDLLLQRGINSLLVITGSHFEKDKSLLPARPVWEPFKHTLYIKKGINVTFEEIDLAYAIYDKSNVQAILAIGGGSVMDLAKGIIYRDIQKQMIKKPLFIAVPTTAGSGSEATCIAVVYDNKVKQSLENQRLMPDIAILDPRLTSKLPPRQTAISGIDAFAQAIESFWSIHATDNSKSLAREAIITLMEYLPQAVHSPTPMIREKVLWASHLAGKAINMTRTTGPHALSYFLSAHHDIPHGQAVGLFLPLFFLYNSTVSENNSNHPDGPATVVQSFKELNSILQVGTSEEAMQFIRRFMMDLGLATSLKDLGLDKPAILEHLLDEVNQQRFKNNPVLFSKDALLSLFREYL
jgi:alcohol dehydrogenase class IV